VIPKEQEIRHQVLWQPSQARNAAAANRWGVKIRLHAKNTRLGMKRSI
jgi:hypothetical protein